MNFTKLLKNRNFLLYSIGQAFSQFGDRLVQIILIGYIYKRWPGSTLQLAKVFLFTILPSFFVSPIAGVYVDRWNKKYVMMISDFLRAVAILAVPIFFIYRESIVPIYAIIFCVFLFACFFLPARLAIIPSLVSKDEILIANSASSITWVVAGIAGFSLGGLLVEWIGIKKSLYINSFVYFLSAVNFALLFFLTRKALPAGREGGPPGDIKAVLGKSFFYELKEGLRALYLNKQIRFVVYIFFLLFSLVGAMYMVAVVFIQETLASMTGYVGLFSMCIFAGLLASSYLYGKAGQKFHRTKIIFIAILFTGVFIDVFAVVLWATKSFWPAGIAAFFLGFCISPIFVAANTIIHESVESNLRGRIFSSIGIIMNIGFLSFMFISSLLAEKIDRIWILLVCGLIFVVIGLISLLAEVLKKPTSSS